MIIFLHGQDSYRSKEKLDQIVSHYKQVCKSALNLMHADAKNTDFSDVYNAINISSMFAQTKLVILKNVFLDKKFQEDFSGQVKNLQMLKDVIVVYEDDEVDKRLKLFKLLIKECKCQEFTLLDARQVKNWAAAKIEEVDAKTHPVKSSEAGIGPKAQQFNRINNDALDLLVSFTGNNLWQLSNEITKLVNFRQGVIKKSDVELLVTPNISVDIFKTIDSLAQKNKKQALILLHKHLDNNENPLYLLSMIGYQFRNLLVVKEFSEQGLMYASIVKKSGLHPFVVKKSYFLCRQFTFEELKNAYRKIFSIDSDIKTGRIEAETALDLFISQI